VSRQSGHHFCQRREPRACGAGLPLTARGHLTSAAGHHPAQQGAERSRPGLGAGDEVQDRDQEQRNGLRAALEAARRSHDVADLLQLQQFGQLRYVLMQHSKYKRLNLEGRLFRAGRRLATLMSWARCQLDSGDDLLQTGDTSIGTEIRRRHHVADS